MRDKTKEKHILGVAEMVKNAHPESLEQAARLLEEYADTFGPRDTVDYTIKPKGTARVKCKYCDDRATDCIIWFESRRFECIGCGARGAVVQRGYTEFDLEKDDG